MASGRSQQQFKALIGIEFDNAEKEVGKLKELVKPLGAAIPKAISDGLKQVEKDIPRLKAALSSATDEEQMRGLEQSMARTVKLAEDIGKKIATAQTGRGQIINVGKTDEQTAALGRLRNQLQQVNTAGVRTTLMSQNMLRVIQDSPFGMLGMANNLQMLAENLSTAKNNGVGFFTALKAGLKDLLMGPMAFAAAIAVITILIQKWDQISAMAATLSEKLAGVAEAQRDLNKAFREFETSEGFDKFLKGVDEDQLDKLRNYLIRRRDMIAGELGVSTIGEAEAERNRLRAGKTVGNAVVGGAGSGAFDARLKQLDEFLRAEEQLRQLYNVKFERQAEDNLRAEAGLENRRQAELDRKEDEAKRRREAELEEQERFLKRMRDGKAKSDELLRKEDEWQAKFDAKTRSERERAFWDSLERERQAREDAMDKARQAARVIRNELQVIMTEVSTGGASATAIGTGTLTPLDSRASTGAKLQQADTKRVLAQARIHEEIAVRQEGIDKIQALMDRSGAIEQNRLRAQQEKLLTEIRVKEQQEQEIIKQSEDEKQKIREESFQKNVQLVEQTVGSVSTIFGNMSNMYGAESEKGMKQHKAFMKAAAWADAIAAGIAVFRNVSQAGKGNPLVMIAAAAAMTATITALGAKIRQIDQGGPGGSSGVEIGGGRFTSLNAATNDQRAAAFQIKQDQLATTAVAVNQNDVVAALQAVAGNLKDQRVVIDSATSAKVVADGTQVNRRRVQVSA